MMNILSFDVEEWYLEKILFGDRTFRYQQFDDTFAKLMDELDRLGIKATFFCVGKLALEFPQVVKSIADRGHDVGCHSNEHTWLDKMDEALLREDTREAIKALEDVSGQRIIAYRAPAFSITEKNKWAIDVLAECGIEMDSSIFPASRDFGGYPMFPQDKPCLVKHGDAIIKEFPIGLTSVMGKRIAYSGGGYFRMLPYGFVKRTMSARDYNISYFHLNDLINQKIKMMNRAEYEEYFKEIGTFKNRVSRYVKSNIGTGDAYGKLMRLFKDMSFVNLSVADQSIDWGNVNTIEL